MFITSKGENVSTITILLSNTSGAAILGIVSTSITLVGGFIGLGAYSLSKYLGL